MVCRFMEKRLALIGRQSNHSRSAERELRVFANRAYLPTASRSRSTSRTGGCPNSRLYSRLNCEASS
jgi:hypothetical protein